MPGGVALIGKQRKNELGSVTVTPLAMPLPPCTWITRAAAEARDRSLWVAGRIVYWNAALGLKRKRRFDMDTCLRIEAALTDEAAARGSNLPVSFRPDPVWLHWCERCAKPFIGGPSARMCSPECAAQARRAAQARQIAKRTQARQERRAALMVACSRCGKPAPSPSRSTRRFCSDACRQGSYRARRAPAAPQQAPSRP
jgi:hypothetical protein